MTVVFYDGECRFCSRIVQFVLKRDRRKHFHFASIQSKAGRKLLAEFGIESPGMDTMYLLEYEQIHQRSTAVLRIARRLPGYRYPARICLLFPKVIRDWCYDRVASNRHRIFQHGSCMVPSEKQRSRFLDRDEGEV